jgi:hypothetical protein
LGHTDGTGEEAGVARDRLTSNDAFTGMSLRDIARNSKYGTYYAKAVSDAVPTGQRPLFYSYVFLDAVPMIAAVCALIAAFDFGNSCTGSRWWPWSSSFPSPESPSGWPA